MTNRLVILGAGGHGRVVADAAEASGSWGEIVFLDDAFLERTMSPEWSIIGTIREAHRILRTSDSYIVAIGSNGVRQQIVERLSVDASPVSIVHPMAAVSRKASIGKGCVVFAGAVINVGAVIGDGVIINTGATVDHDCRIGSFSHICPGAHLAGNVSVGAGSWVGIGASINQGLSIGSKAVVGASAAVVRDVLDAATVIGVPAKNATNS